MLFVCYPKCTTCQRAQKWLDDNKIAYQLRDIKQENPTYDELYEWHKNSKLDIKRFFNTSGLLYKSLSLKDKLATLSIEDKLKLLSTDGMLVKRPIAVIGDKVLVGFREDEWKEALIK